MENEESIQYTFEWTPEMSVGDEHLDSQHRQLLGEINNLLVAMLNQDSESVIQETIGFLDGYIKGHLADEEVYMQEHHYPYIDAHKVMHEDFIRKYSEFKERLAQEGPHSMLVSDVQTYIGQWWVNHIINEDKKYAEYIRAQR